MVQGNDLLVRDGFVWLKSIDQLERVDVIIKRLDDAWCDPLELRRDSLLGIPGLLQVIRLGNVSVLNPPGTSVLENYGLMAFMQNACKFLLNEPLLMNSVAIWWCGQTKELNFVLENLPKLIIKKIIFDLKYYDATHLSNKFSELILAKLKADLASYDLIIAVPLHKNRLRQRKFNQSILVQQGS